MAFQLTRLNVPNLTTDYSAETSAASNLAGTLGNLFTDFRKQQAESKKQEILGQIGSGKLDYDKAGRALITLGDTRGGATLLSLGQKQRQLEGASKVSDMFSGGGTLGSPVGTPTASLGSPNEVESRFVNTVKQAGLTNPVGLGAVAAYGNAESKYNPGNVNRTWSDPAESGAAGTSGGIMSWRADRLQNLQRFAAAKGEQGNGSPETQALFLAQEDPTLVPRLNAAKSPQEANQIMAQAWRFAGHDRPGQGEYARREGLTQQYAQRFAGQPQAPQPVQVAETEADVQRLEGSAPQMPGSGGVYATVPTPALQAFIANPKVPDNLRGLMQQELARREGSGQPPVQMAQAGAQPGAPVNDAAAMPAPGAQPVTGPATTQAAQAQGFAIPGTSLPPNDPYPNISTKQLYGVATNPNATPEQQRLANGIIERRLKYTDENAPDKREMTRLQTEKLRREVEGEGARPMTAKERADYNVPEGQPAYMSRQGDPKFGPAGTRITNANTFDGKGESKFNEALGTAQAKRWNGYIEEGDVAQGRIADIQTLRDASRRLGSQGSSANLKSTIGPYAESLGIKIEGLGDIQLYESITNRLAPTLRAPGSGSTSDIEFKGFMRAIGPLSNTPAAREMILDTFEAASRNDLARSEIASRLAEGQINRGQAEKEIRALPNPLEGFRKFREANPDLVGQAIKETGQRQVLEKSGPPKITSPEQAGKLPSGTEFIDPNGIKRRVP